MKLVKYTSLQGHHFRASIRRVDVSFSQLNTSMLKCNTDPYLSDRRMGARHANTVRDCRGHCPLPNQTVACSHRACCHRLLTWQLCCRVARTHQRLRSTVRTLTNFTHARTSRSSKMWCSKFAAVLVCLAALVTVDATHDGMLGPVTVDAEVVRSCGALLSFVPVRAVARLGGRRTHS
jgi:hypothetical protein